MKLGQPQGTQSVPQFVCSLNFNLKFQGFFTGLHVDLKDIEESEVGKPLSASLIYVLIRNLQIFISLIFNERSTIKLRVP